jgi:hypothetical protein
MRLSLLSLILPLAMAAPAAAHTWDGSPSGTFDVTLEVMGYTQVQWQDTTIDFAFDNYTIAGGDYIRQPAGGVRGIYAPLDGTSAAPGGKSSGDAWTDAYYESRDGAYLWLDTNTDVVMTVTSGGDLTNGTATLATWFTLAGSGDWSNGFLRGGLWMNDGNIPGDGAGSYAADDIGPDNIMEMGGTFFHPDQYPFPMVGAGSGPWTLDLNGHSKGNLMWLGRVKRNGMDDPAGVYTTTIGVAFSL